MQHIGNDHKIADFAFTNQNGESNYTKKIYENTIYVADFFLQLAQLFVQNDRQIWFWLQNQLKSNPEVKLLSFSVTPDIDTHVLKNMLKKKGVDDSRWNLVTGNKKTSII